MRVRACARARMLACLLAVYIILCKGCKNYNNDNNNEKKKKKKKKNFISKALFRVKLAQLRCAMPMNNTHTRARARVKNI